MALKNKDLLAISRLLDSKLDEKLKPIETRVELIDNRLEHVENQVGQIDNRVEHIDTRVEHIEYQVKHIDIDLLETNVIPRLNTIESCYTETYNRYKDYADKFQAFYSDVELLKKVVSEHSEKLQRIS